MSFRIKYLPEAKQELHQGIAWYAKKAKGLGKRFASAVSQAMKPLRKLPKMHSIVIKENRKNNFPISMGYCRVGRTYS